MNIHSNFSSIATSSSLSNDESTFHYTWTNDFFGIQDKIIIHHYGMKKSDPIDEILETGFAPTSFHASTFTSTATWNGRIISVVTQICRGIADPYFRWIYYPSNEWIYANPATRPSTSSFLSSFSSIHVIITWKRT